MWLSTSPRYTHAYHCVITQRNAVSRDNLVLPSLLLSNFYFEKFCTSFEERYSAKWRYRIKARHCVYLALFEFEENLLIFCNLILFQYNPMCSIYFCSLFHEMYDLSKSRSNLNTNDSNRNYWKSNRSWIGPIGNSECVTMQINLEITLSIFSNCAHLNLSFSAFATGPTNFDLFK